MLDHQKSLRLDVLILGNIPFFNDGSCVHPRSITSRPIFARIIALWASNHFIGRNISCLIKLSWTEAEVIQRAKTMAALIRESIA